MSGAKSAYQISPPSSTGRAEYMLSVSKANLLISTTRITKDTCPKHYKKLKYR